MADDLEGVEPTSINPNLIVHHHHHHQIHHHDVIDEAVVAHHPHDSMHDGLVVVDHRLPPQGNHHQQQYHPDVGGNEDVDDDDVDPDASIPGPDPLNRHLTHPHGSSLVDQNHHHHPLVVQHQHPPHHQQQQQQFHGRGDIPQTFHPQHDGGNVMVVAGMQAAQQHQQLQQQYHHQPVQLPPIMMEQQQQQQLQQKGTIMVVHPQQQRRADEDDDIVTDSASATEGVVGGGGGLDPPLSKKPRRRYDNNFKAEVLEHLQTPGAKLPSIAKQFNIPDNTLREWTKVSVVQAIEAARSKNSGQLKANMYDPMYRLTEQVMTFFVRNEQQPQQLKQPVTTKLIVAKGLEAKTNLLELNDIQPFLDPKERKALESFTGSDSWAKKFAKRHDLKMTGARIKALQEHDVEQYHQNIKQMANRIKQAGPAYEQVASLLRQADEKLLQARAATRRRIVTAVSQKQQQLQQQHQEQPLPALHISPSQIHHQPLQHLHQQQQQHHLVNIAMAPQQQQQQQQQHRPPHPSDPTVMVPPTTVTTTTTTIGNGTTAAVQNDIVRPSFQPGSIAVAYAAPVMKHLHHQQRLQLSPSPPNLDV